MYYLYPLCAVFPLFVFLRLFFVIIMHCMTCFHTIFFVFFFAFFVVLLGL